MADLSDVINRVKALSSGYEAVMELAKAAEALAPYDDIVKSRQAEVRRANEAAEAAFQKLAKIESEIEAAEKVQKGVAEDVKAEAEAILAKAGADASGIRAAAEAFSREQEAKAAVKMGEANQEVARLAETVKALEKEILGKRALVSELDSRLTDFRAKLSL